MIRTKFYCKCGCGKIVNFHRGKPYQYIKWHNRKGKTCSLEQKQKIANNPYRKTPEYIEKQRLAQTGRKHSEETKIKMSKSHKGKIFSKETLKRMSFAAKLRDNATRQKSLEAAWKATTGIPVPLERRKKQSDAAKLNNKLEKNPAWKGGISFLPYHYKFDKNLKYNVRLRDGFHCQICGKSEIDNKTTLSVHHINYDKLCVDPNKLISLCTSCHGKTSTGNRKYWCNLLTNKVNNNAKNKKRKNSDSNSMFRFTYTRRSTCL